ncbi:MULTISPECIES: hypothetical protein [unclassified Pseudomonas]|uniref:hypothetical protein n=1 Tax=unclassified Pseudomonas TaxID=196821 RepID=UPI000D3CD088|nr:MULTISPECIES: hypothetical protein [unclassified Pseudomonas]RAU42187.1 hypothetical protein DBP26_022460 [Pseudomonas sp. RIT 409]RAU49766.1 hypothetical protein DBY65_023475 [Pseudomonas sp. RIT 412]
MSNKRSPITMEGWNRDWIIHGHKLVCRACGAGQCPTLNEQPFRHTDACRISAQGVRYPWKELNDILKDNLSETRRMLH